MQIIGFGYKALGCPCWTECAGVKKHLAPNGALQHIQVPKQLRVALLPSVRAGHSSCLSPLCLPCREDIVAPGLTLCILPRGDEHPLGAPLSSHILGTQTPSLSSLLATTREQNTILVPPASRVTRTLQTSMQKVTFLSPSFLIERETLVAQSVPTIFDG